MVSTQRIPNKLAIRCVHWYCQIISGRCGMFTLKIEAKQLSKTLVSYDITTRVIIQKIAIWIFMSVKISGLANDRDSLIWAVVFCLLGTSVIMNSCLVGEKLLWGRDLRLSRRWRFKSTSSGLWRRVVLR